MRFTKAVERVCWRKCGVDHFGKLFNFFTQIIPGYLWRFTQNVPKGYWDKQEHQQSFFTWLGGQLGMNHMDDWYRVTKKAIETNGGGSLLDKYGSSPSKLLELVYPEYPWTSWCFDAMPKGFWTNFEIDTVEEILIFVKWLGKQLDIKSSNDWYQISGKQLQKYISQHEFTVQKLPKMLKIAYLHYKYDQDRWLLRIWETLPKEHWEKKDNQRYYLEWLGKQLGISQLEDWYRVTAKVIQCNGGAVLLDKFNSSITKLFQSVYPGHKWFLWIWEIVPKGFWDQKGNQKSFLNWLGEFLNFKQMDDWYQVTLTDITDNGGSTLLQKFGSHSKMLQSVYPEYSWSLLRFGQVPKGFWTHISEIQHFVKWLGEQLQN